MGHKLTRMIQVTPMIAMVLMTLIVTVMDIVTWFGPRKGMGCGLCHVFENTLYPTRDLMEDNAVP